MDLATVTCEEVLLELTIYGHAEPAGSKKAFVPQKDGKPFRDRNGRIIVNVTDDNPKSKGWKAQIAETVGVQWEGRPLLDGPVAVEFVFYRQRPKGHFGTGRNAGRLKAWALRLFPTTKPDTLKLARGVEDALTGVVWTDDSRVVDEVLRKRYGSPERVEITIAKADPQCALDALDPAVHDPLPDSEADDQLALV